MHIAIAIDGSDHALRAIKHAIYLARHLPKASLEIIYVVDFNKIKNDHLLSQSPETLTLIRERTVSPAIKLIEEAEMKATVTMLKGDPSKEIIHYVNKQPIEQLFLGSRGLNTLQEMILGSVSHKVVKHVSCPVTIIK